MPPCACAVAQWCLTTIVFMSRGQTYISSIYCHAQIRAVPYLLWGFQYSKMYHKWGIGIGLSPIGYEGSQTWKGQGEARPNLYDNNFVDYSYDSIIFYMCICLCSSLLCAFPCFHLHIYQCQSEGSQSLRQDAGAGRIGSGGRLNSASAISPAGVYWNGNIKTYQETSCENGFLCFYMFLYMFLAFKHSISQHAQVTIQPICCLGWSWLGLNSTPWHGCCHV